MIRIPITLDQWGMGTNITTLGTLIIGNRGDSPNPKRGNYTVKMYGKNGKLIREAEVLDHPRQSAPVGTLVRKALEAMGY